MMSTLEKILCLESNSKVGFQQNAYKEIFYFLFNSYLGFFFYCPFFFPQGLTAQVKETQPTWINSIETLMDIMSMHRPGVAMKNASVLNGHAENF